MFAIVKPLTIEEPAKRLIKDENCSTRAGNVFFGPRFGLIVDFK